VLVWVPRGMKHAGFLRVQRDSPEPERTMDTTLTERVDRLEQIEALKQLDYHCCAVVDTRMMPTRSRRCSQRMAYRMAATLETIPAAKSSTRVSWNRVLWCSGRATSSPTLLSTLLAPGRGANGTCGCQRSRTTGHQEPSRAAPTSISVAASMANGYLNICR
jgi:hypothetical protein